MQFSNSTNSLFYNCVAQNTDVAFLNLGISYFNNWLSLLIILPVWCFILFHPKYLVIQSKALKTNDFNYIHLYISIHQKSSKLLQSLDDTYEGWKYAFITTLDDCKNLRIKNKKSGSKEVGSISRSNLWTNATIDNFQG